MILVLGNTNDHERFARQGIFSVLQIGNIGASIFSGDYFNPSPNPLVHTWSLSLEVQIYLLLPIFLILFLRMFKNISKIIKITFVSITFTSLILFLTPEILYPLYSQIGFANPEIFSYYSIFCRIWQFTLGGLGYFFNNRFQTCNKSLKLLNLTLVFTLLILLFSSISLNSKSSSIIASFLTLNILIFKSFDVLPVFYVKKLEWLGYRSYSIYLIHFPLIYLGKNSQIFLIGNSEGRVIQSILATLISILMGHFSYSTIENKFRGRAKNELLVPKSISFFIILLLPLSFFLTIDRAVKYDYFGLNRDIARPAFAGDVISGCKNDLFLGLICTNKVIGATQTVLLIGDSHAGHFSIAIKEASKNVNWNYSYLPSVLVQEFDLRSKNTDSNSRHVREYIEKNKPDLVIVSQFWRSGSNQASIRDGLSELRSLVPRVLLLENTPVWPDGTKFRFNSPLIMPYKPPKSFAQSEMQFKDKSTSDSLAAWAINNAISTMNLNSLFCNTQICNRYSDGDWLYRDDNHLSVAGAELAVSKFEAFIKTL